MPIDLPSHLHATAPQSAEVCIQVCAADDARAMSALDRPIVLATSQVARPGHFAEREELDAALKAGTSERLKLFIERHPNSRYRAEAETALRRFEAQRKR